MYKRKFLLRHARKLYSEKKIGWWNGVVSQASATMIGMPALFVISQDFVTEADIYPVSEGSYVYFQSVDYFSFSHLQYLKQDGKRRVAKTEMVIVAYTEYIYRKKIEN